MKLPGELRNRIYELVLPSNATINFRLRNKKSREQRANIAVPHRLKKSHEPALLRVSKAIRGETMKLYYQLNEFAFIAYSNECKRIYEFLRAKSAGRHGSITIRWNIYVIGPNLSDIAHWLALAKAIFRTSAAYTRDSNVRNAWCKGQGYSVGAVSLVEVQKLARKARDRGLRKRHLVRDFLDWAAVKLNMSPKLKGSASGRHIVNRLAGSTGDRDIVREYQGNW